MTPTSARQLLEAAREGLQKFLAKWEECEPHVNDAFFHRQLRMGPYSGPQFAAELAELRHLAEQIDQWVAGETELDAKKLEWHIPENLRWMAENGCDRYTPCGSLPGELLKVAADRYEQLAAENEQLRERLAAE